MPRILGVDPGSRITGYGVVDCTGARLRYVAAGCIRVSGDTIADRLGAISEGIAAVLDRYHPEEVAIEQVFMHRNAQSALKLGQARGVAIVASARGGTPVFEYSATQVKLATTGKGHAAKEQVQHMIRVLLGQRGEIQADAADALAVAICHGHHRATASRIVPAAAGAGALARAIAGGPRRRRSTRWGST